MWWTDVHTNTLQDYQSFQWTSLSLLLPVVTCLLPIWLLWIYILMDGWLQKGWKGAGIKKLKFLLWNHFRLKINCDKNLQQNSIEKKRTKWTLTELTAEGREEKQCRTKKNPGIKRRLKSVWVQKDLRGLGDEPRVKGQYGKGNNQQGSLQSYKSSVIELGPGRLWELDLRQVQSAN